MLELECDTLHWLDNKAVHLFLWFSFMVFGTAAFWFKGLRKFLVTSYNSCPFCHGHGISTNVPDVYLGKSGLHHWKQRSLRQQHGLWQWVWMECRCWKYARHARNARLPKFRMRDANDARDARPSKPVRLCSGQLWLAILQLRKLGKLFRQSIAWIS